MSVHQIDRNRKTVKIDFAGTGEDHICYRNDASVLFFAANSYKQAYFILGKNLEERFDSGCKDRLIEHLILPYLFNFRQYVELELKAIITAITSKSPNITHKLDVLMNDAKSIIESIPTEEDSFFITNSEEHKDKAIKIMTEIEILLERFLENEPAADFYRYIFTAKGGEIALGESTISLDFHKTKELFSTVTKLFNDFYFELREAGIYIYQL